MPGVGGELTDLVKIFVVPLTQGNKSDRQLSKASETGRWRPEIFQGNV